MRIADHCLRRLERVSLSSADSIQNWYSWLSIHLILSPTCSIRRLFTFDLSRVHSEALLFNLSKGNWACFLNHDCLAGRTPLFTNAFLCDWRFFWALLTLSSTYFYGPIALVEACSYTPASSITFVRYHKPSSIPSHVLRQTNFDQVNNPLYYRLQRINRSRLPWSRESAVVLSVGLISLIIARMAYSSHRDLFSSLSLSRIWWSSTLPLIDRWSAGCRSISITSLSSNVRLFSFHTQFAFTGQDALNVWIVLSAIRILAINSAFARA